MEKKEVRYLGRDRERERGKKGRGRLAHDRGVT
jgi:hypothetical protein